MLIFFAFLKSSIQDEFGFFREINGKVIFFLKKACQRRFLSKLASEVASDTTIVEAACKTSNDSVESIFSSSRNV